MIGFLLGYLLGSPSITYIEKKPLVPRKMTKKEIQEKKWWAKNASKMIKDTDERYLIGEYL